MSLSELAFVDTLVDIGRKCPHNDRKIIGSRKIGFKKRKGHTIGILFLPVTCTECSKPRGHVLLMTNFRVNLKVDSSSLKVSRASFKYFK